MSPNPAVEVIDDPETGARVYRMGDVESVVACFGCGVPIIPKSPGQRTCGAPACREAARVLSPEQRVAKLERSRAWAAEHRGCKRPRPWLRGTPPHLPYLPGGGITISVSPPPRWPIEHRNIRAFHGMMTMLVGLPHQRFPEWSLVPWPEGCGWGAYLRQDDVAARLSNRTVEGVLYDRPVTIKTGPLVRIKAPVVRKRGRQKIRLVTMTPVVIETDGRTVTRTMPTVTSIVSALTHSLPDRLGLVGFDSSLVVLNVMSHETQTEVVPLGGKGGPVKGWVGSVVLEVNAVSRWLLEAAARGPGLGGRVAFGFGRIRVEGAT